MTTPQSPITLTVSDLNAATSFYLSALQSLGYQHQSRVQHQTPGSTSYAVGIGPSNTTRVDLFLSESGNANRARRRKHAHVVFPAPSRIAVRDFYAAGLNAGGRPVSPPELKPHEQGLFAATIQDPDGHKVEVCFADPTAQDISPRGNEGSRALESPANNSIHNWREQVSGNVQARAASASRDPNPAMARARPSSTSRRRPSSADSAKRPSSVKSAGGENSSGKAVVGTLLGAAAGAAVVYAFTKETQDSKAKEAKFDERREGRDRLKAEARERAYALAWREKAKANRERRSLGERDSGYYSGGGSQRREQSPEKPRYRSVTYPQGSAPSDRDRDSVTSSSRTVRAIEQGPPPQRTMSHRSRPPVSHVTVSKPPSELRRLSPPPNRQYDTRGPAPPRSTTGSRTVRRYIPIAAESYHSSRAPPPTASRDWDEYYDDDDDSGDGLDDETVVPDDSISVAPTDAPSHKVETRRRRPIGNGPPPSGRGRPGVAVY